MKTVIPRLLRQQRLIWSDDRGSILTIELLLVATIAVIGLVSGIGAAREAWISELSDVGFTIQRQVQFYSLLGLEGHSGSTAGSFHLDNSDHCDGGNDTPGAPPNCIKITHPIDAIDEGA